MALRTGCIYSVPEPWDGVRISVMSRHTLDDGKTSDPRITDKSYDEHLSVLAPGPGLLGDYYKRGIPWQEFEQRYRASLHTKHAELCALARRAQMQDITLLCKEATPERCHRRVLAEEIQRLAPGLDVIIR